MFSKWLKWVEVKQLCHCLQHIFSVLQVLSDHCYFKFGLTLERFSYPLTIPLPSLEGKMLNRTTVTFVPKDQESLRDPKEFLPVH